MINLRVKRQNSNVQNQNSVFSPSWSLYNVQFVNFDSIRLTQFLSRRLSTVAITQTENVHIKTSVFSAALRLLGRMRDPAAQSCSSGLQVLKRTTLKPQKHRQIRWRRQRFSDVQFDHDSPSINQHNGFETKESRCDRSSSIRVFISRRRKTNLPSSRNMKGGTKSEQHFCECPLGVAAYTRYTCSVCDGGK